MKCALSALVLILAVGLSGCGVPVDDDAQTVVDVPFGLLDPEPSERPETIVPTEGPMFQIFLVDPSRTQLVAAERRLSDSSLPAVLDELMQGPTGAESRSGLTTAFPNEMQVVGVELVGGVASVNLTQDFTVIDGPTQRLGIAQIVLTLTGRPGVGRVAFTLEGQPIDIPRGDGTLVAGSVSRDNYRELFASA